MGFPRNSCTSFIENRHPPFSKGQTLGHTDPDEHFDFVNCHSDEDEVKLKSLLHRMIWDFGLSCFVSHGRQRSSGKDVGDDGGFCGKNLEHNTAWLLAESGGSGGDEPHSVHSSFRFSLYSQVELEKMSFNPDCSSATILMVNLDNGFLTDSKSSELKWSRIESLERSISPVAHSLHRFSYSEILSITRNFSKGRVLGRGALSYVFRGTVGFLRTAVAIKRLVKDDKESSKAFCRELMVASSLDNPHIVPLLGFCIDPEGGLFLVYKYVSGGSLQQFLHDAKKGVKGGHALPWSSRYKVAVGIAEAINYLHNGTERCVVHRDIKPSNILLSSRKNPKLCDFGLASWTPAPSVPFLCKTVKGTFGYLAPEYFQHGKVSDKTDVYAFGVVLLELITGRNPIETKRGPGEENLVSWAKPLLHQGCLEKLLDPRLGSTPKDIAQIARLIQAASACINNDDSLRPGAGEVIEILRGEEHKEFSRRKAILPSRSTRMDSNSHLQLTNSEMKNHFALAMLGVEFEDDDHFYCR